MQEPLLSPCDSGFLWVDICIVVSKVHMAQAPDKGAHQKDSVDGPSTMALCLEPSFQHLPGDRLSETDLLFTGVFLLNGSFFVIPMKQKKS